MEFADVLFAGTLFYDWITIQPGYYPRWRWEWQATIDEILLEQRPATRGRLIEVGCGTGQFLSLAREKTDLALFGIDLTEQSVEACRSNGLDVERGQLEPYARAGGPNHSTFDVAVSFHCLEHIREPKRFVESLRDVLKPGGTAYLSTPYSPMSFEADWYDPLNNPPHHLTRWNLDTYHELSRQVGMEMSYILPPRTTVARRTKTALTLRWFGPQGRPSRLRLLAMAARSPLVTVGAWTRQMRRERLPDGAVAPDVILIKLRKQLDTPVVRV